MTDYALQFYSSMPAPKSGTTDGRLGLTDTTITWGRDDRVQERRFSDIVWIVLETLSTEEPGETSFQAKFTFQDGLALTVFCRCAKTPAVSEEEKTYRDFLLALHGKLTTDDKRRIQFRNGDGKLALWSTVLSFPIAIIFAIAMLIRENDPPIVAAVILCLVVAAYGFAFFVFYSPARRFYDPDRLPAKVIPQPGG